MYRYREALFIIISLRFTTAITCSVYQQEDDCPEKCHCEETKVNCTDLIRRVIILCSTIPTVCITIAVIVTYLVSNRRRKRLAYKQFEDTVKLIRDGNFRFEFPVFLSYSSENHPFVVNHILEPLQVGGNMLALFSSLNHL